MATNVFNFKPASTAPKNASYTIPANKYAFITASVKGSISFHLGATEMLHGSAHTAYAGAGGASIDSVAETLGGWTELNSNGHRGASQNLGFFSQTWAENPIQSASYWLESGDVLDGTGAGSWAAWVTEYDE